jgi:hypothetical protein
MFKPVSGKKASSIESVRLDEALLVELACEELEVDTTEELTEELEDVEVGPDADEDDTEVEDEDVEGGAVAVEVDGEVVDVVFEVER